MPTRNVRIDNVFVSGSGTHAVETYGVDGITIGTVTARNVHDSGLLLNQTVNATVGTVDADNTGTGTGYAAFRMANRNGRIGSSYPTNIRVGQVIARGGGRGVFCVSESGGAVIDRVTITNAGNNSILVENCYNVTVAGVSGTVTGGGEIRHRLAHRVPAVVERHLPEHDGHQHEHQVEPLYRHEQRGAQRDPGQLQPDLVLTFVCPARLGV